jgi:hypothetical protein
MLAECGVPRTIRRIGCILHWSLTKVRIVARCRRSFLAERGSFLFLLCVQMLREIVSSEVNDEEVTLAESGSPRG